MPLAAIVEGKILAMHGGISQELNSWDQISKIQRPGEVPETGLVCDLLWSDPDKGILQYQESYRGVSYVFGKHAVRDFCRKMKIDLIVRAHQVPQDGYEFFADRRLITIFSAPNYCGDFGNSASVLHISETLCASIRIIRPLECPIPAQDDLSDTSEESSSGQSE